MQISYKVTGEANYAIDLDLGTQVTSGKASDGGIWIEVTLKQIYCVDYVIEYNRNQETVQFRWDCSKDDCSDCKFKNPSTSSAVCKEIPLTATTTDTPLSLPQLADCKNGDKVKIQRVSGNRDTITVAEVAIFGKKGNSESKFTLINGKHLNIMPRQ